MKIEFEGPKFELKIYTASDPAAIVRAHAADAGLPVLPPKWMFTPWRWRDEHTQRTTYYDGTPVTAPFNSEIMEDVLMMKAYGIPNGVYWIDRPWGPGKMGYDDFDIDYKRLPHFGEMVKWLDAQRSKDRALDRAVFSGKDGGRRDGRKATRLPVRSGRRAATIIRWSISSNPKAKEYWQAGIEKLLKLGVAGFKLDRGEENIPDDGPHKIFDGRTIRENRNAYTPMYVKAVYDIAKKNRGDDFVLMPRGGLHGDGTVCRKLGRRHRRNAGRIAGVDNRGAAVGRDGLFKLGLGHVRLQPATDGTGSLRAMAGVQRVHADHGGRADQECRVLELRRVSRNTTRR